MGLGKPADYAAILESILTRDKQDRERAVAPCARQRTPWSSTPRT